MKEITFLKQNYQKWQQFEDLLNSNQRQNPDALADLFIRITDDLSWAHTFYPGSNTEKYLNDLAARIHQEIYKNKKEKRSRLITFWTQEIPRLMAKNRLNLFIVFLIFVASVWIGVISAQHDEKFVRLILGDGYVDMTLDNMSKGDPLGVYKGENQFTMFFGIALNNSRVALLCIVAGILGWIGVAYLQFMNGVMLGAFLYFLGEHGFYHEAMLTVWIHGVIEIFCILVAGAAGMAFGNGLFFPGAWPRGVSFMRGAREALKIGVGLIPFFFLAAFFEGFVTRFTAMNDVARVAIILSALVFVLWYFVFLPYAITANENKSRAERITASERKGLFSKMGPYATRFAIVGIAFQFFAIALLLINAKSTTQFSTLPISMFCHAATIICFVISFFASRFHRPGMQVNSQFGFMLSVGFLLFFLPTIPLSMQAITKTHADVMTYLFFAACQLGGVLMVVFGFRGRKKIEEDDLIIDRKGSGKADEYERSATATKI